MNKARTKRQGRLNKYFLYLLALTIVIAIGCGVTWLVVNRADSGLRLVIAADREPYTTTRYAVFGLTMKNNSLKDIYSPFGTCAENRQIFIDGVQLKPKPASPRAVCAIGYGPVAPGKQDSENMKISLRGLGPGKHKLEVVSDKIPAEAIIDVLEGKKHQCNGFVEYELTHCDQISITNGTGTYGDGKQVAMDRCQRTKQRYFAGKTYQPIVSIGTPLCNWWNTQLVFNVAPKDTKKVFAELSDKKAFRTNIQITGQATRDDTSFSKEWLEYAGR